MINSNENVDISKVSLDLLEVENQFSKYERILNDKLFIGKSGWETEFIEAFKRAIKTLDFQSSTEDKLRTFDNLVFFLPEP